MLIRRLTWCGVELEATDGSTAVVDLLEDLGPLKPVVGPPRAPLAQLRYIGRARVAAVTHMHRDHADATAIARALRFDGVLLRPPPTTGADAEVVGTHVAEQELGARDDLTIVILQEGERAEAGPFRFTALRGIDGSGDPQHTWLIEVDGHTVVHAGDTMWHGEWWRRAIAYGPIDVAFLPINGVVVDFPARQPASGLPATMTPEQAVAAAAAMGARQLIPIHYGVFDHPPQYTAIAHAEERLLSAAQRRGVSVLLPPLGEQIRVPASADDAALATR